MSTLRKQLGLEKYDYIVTAYAQPASGPGWSNRPLWVIVGNPAKSIREICIQPQQQTTAMHMLYDFSALAHREMVSAVDAAIRVNK